MRKRAASFALCLCMVLSLLPGPILAIGKHPFTDVAATDWFNDSVQYVYDHGLMNGISRFTFAPYQTTQRGMIVTILYRLEGSPNVTSSNPFIDVPKGSNYEKAIIWAEKNNVVNGYDAISFGPYDNITRQQMATILYRYAQMKGYRTSGRATLRQYSDSNQIGSYARIAMAWANSEGLINGNENKQLMPTGSASRAQAAVILTRFCQNVVPSIPESSNSTIPSSPINRTTPTNPPPPSSKTYSVTFNPNYSGSGQIQTVSVQEGQRVTIPTPPTRSGYTFNGWYTSSIGGHQFDFDTAINANTSLYARWSAIESDTPIPLKTYTVTFNFNYTGSAQNQTVTVKEGNKVVAPTAPVRSGYTFDGWYTSATGGYRFDFSVSINANISLYARWNPIETLAPTSSVSDSVESSLSKYESIFSSTSELETQYIDNDGYVQSDEVDELLSSVSEYASTLYQEGEITDYSYEDGDTCVYMEIDGWLGYLYSPKIEDALAGDSSDTIQVITYEPFAHQIATQVGYLFTGLKGPDDAAKSIVDVFGSPFEFKANYDNADVSIESLLKMGANSIIIWDGHGGYNSKFGPLISLGSPRKLGNRVIYYMTTSDYLYRDKSLMIINDHCCVTPIFFEKHMVEGALDGSLIYLATCSSLQDNRLAQSLMNKGARCVVGSSTTIQTIYSMRMMYDFFSALTQTSTDGDYYSVRDALNYARSRNGEHDPRYGGTVNIECPENFSLPDMVQSSNVSIDYESLVTDAYSNTVTYNSNVYDENAGVFRDVQVTASYHIPRININSEDVIKANKAIYDTLYPVVRDSIAEAEEYGAPERSHGISYKWCVNKDILSLVICDVSYPNSSGGDEYLVYNVSIPFGRLLSNESVIQAAGFTTQEYYEKARQVLGSSFYEQAEEIHEDMFKDSSFVALLNQVKERTMSSENIGEAEPYINEHNQLCIIAKKYSLAGADYYYFDYNMLDFRFYEEYAQPFVVRKDAPVPTPAPTPESVNITLSDLNGTWTIDSSYTMEQNGVSMIRLFGTGYRYGNEMSFDAQDMSFEYYVGIGVGDCEGGRFSISGNTIQYSLEKNFFSGQPESGIMTVIKANNNTVYIVMDYLDDYKLYWMKE